MGVIEGVGVTLGVGLIVAVGLGVTVGLGVMVGEIVGVGVCASAVAINKFPNAQVQARAKEKTNLRTNNTFTHRSLP
ncbi:MAG TPA: hypothetical protein VLI42_04950 [Chthoniobacterales bacterium]|nr:hypothetical protein [Chthoniobacterales bacterium]